MNKAARVVITIICALATLFFTFWMSVALVFENTAAALIFALALAFLVARFVWTQTGKTRPGLGKSIALGAIVTGGIGFVVGFFGPMILAPGANQGPLLGLFITGPLGFLLGGVGGAIYWFVRGRHEARADTPPKGT